MGKKAKREKREGKRKGAIDRWILRCLCAGLLIRMGSLEARGEERRVEEYID